MEHKPFLKGSNLSIKLLMSKTTLDTKEFIVDKKVWNDTRVSFPFEANYPFIRSYKWLQ